MTVDADEHQLIPQVNHERPSRPRLTNPSPTDSDRPHLQSPIHAFKAWQVPPMHQHSSTESRPLLPSRLKVNSSFGLVIVIGSVSPTSPTGFL